MLIELLGDLPQEAGLGVANESKLALQIADALKVELETNPLLRSHGAPFDPAVLLGDGGASIGSESRSSTSSDLPGLEAQRYFLNQLAMTLFSWIKKYPDPGERPLRGLLVIDEAKDFVPSQKSSVCRESLLRLAAQARKYHLGLGLRHAEPQGHRQPDRGELLDPLLRQGELARCDRDRSRSDPSQRRHRRRCAEAVQRAVLLP